MTEAGAHASYHGPIIDAHVHLFPERMLQAVIAFFERHGFSMPHRKPAEELVADLAGHGVVAYTLLNYVRQPGQAESLNAWTVEFAASHPEAIPFGTVHLGDPDPLVTIAPYLDRLMGLKIQPLVSEFGLDAPRLDPVLARLEEQDKILITHSGTAPYANEWVGLDRLETVLRRHPRLRVVCAHMGAYEIDRALRMLDEFENLFLDTAVMFVRAEMFPKCPVPPAETWSRYEDRIMFGSDFPLIAYPYDKALESISRLPLSDTGRKKIYYENAARLFGWVRPVVAREVACSK